jgi:hypothetical protein
MPKTAPLKAIQTGFAINLEKCAKNHPTPLMKRMPAE